MMCEKCVPIREREIWTLHGTEKSVPNFFNSTNNKQTPEAKSPGVCGCSIRKTGGRGFEPRFTAPKAAVLPLYDPPLRSADYTLAATQCQGEMTLHTAKRLNNNSVLLCNQPN